jgi:hypothetical protein
MRFSDNKARIDSTLRHLSLPDRVAALITSIVTARDGAVGDSVVMMIGTIIYLASKLRAPDCWRLAEALRDAADSVERLKPLEPVTF